MLQEIEARRFRAAQPLMQPLHIIAYVTPRTHIQCHEACLERAVGGRLKKSKTNILNQSQLTDLNHIENKLNLFKSSN